MSEVVVRMNFPKRCYDCDMADGLTCMATGGVYGRDVPKMTWIRGKPSWCPIVCALPENHGRLVDADELESRCRPVKNFENTDSLVIGVGPLRCSKTIVPATETEATPCP